MKRSNGSHRPGGRWRRPLTGSRGFGPLSASVSRTLLGLGLGAWTLGLLWLAREQERIPLARSVVSVEQARRVGSPGSARRIGPSGSGPLAARRRQSEDEVIDMRELNQRLAFDDPDGGVWTQGFEVLPAAADAEHPLTVLVVPHSHCDPGWLKTFDEYFEEQLNPILSSVVASLAKDERRKFIWAEISIFERWWNVQEDEARVLFRRLLRDGQFEFVTGGWVQPDEANTQLYAMEIQLQEGHHFIRETFGEEYIPKHGWSLDPFGYSPTMAYLLRKNGFEGMLIQRVHYAVKKELALNRQLEFLWRQTWDRNGEYDILTHVMPFYSYDVSHSCGPDPSVCCQFDFARIQFDDGSYAEDCPWGKPAQPINGSNVEERAALLLDQYRKKSALYRSDVVIAPLGDDFRYQTEGEANDQFENYQRIFDYLNEKVDGVTIRFGTLSEYFHAIAGAFDPPVLKGSFFTYSDRGEDYWSGYYTSRAFDKALDRRLERALYAAASMGASAAELRESRRALSLFQHHDGITGTAREHVMADYAARIHVAIRQCQDWMAARLRKEEVAAGWLSSCWQSDGPRLPVQNRCGDSGDVLAYNPLETEQTCGSAVVPGRSHARVRLPCEVPGAISGSRADIRFDPETGLMTHPVKEEWMAWDVRKGGAYLFVPGRLVHHRSHGLEIKRGGFVVESRGWKRAVVERSYPSEFGTRAIVIDFVYEISMQTFNEEWLVRLSAGVSNDRVLHTDLNGYNFDTHRFRSDMPIQSQVFPMPTHASIEDSSTRLTVLSEHAQGVASLEEGSVDVWLDRRLVKDDGRGLGESVRDNAPTLTKLRVILEREGYDSGAPEFKTTPLTGRMWKELDHPLEFFSELEDE